MSTGLISISFPLSLSPFPLLLIFSTVFIFTKFIFSSFYSTSALYVAFVYCIFHLKRWYEANERNKKTRIRVLFLCGIYFERKIHSIFNEEELIYLFSPLFRNESYFSNNFSSFFFFFGKFQFLSLAVRICNSYL